MQEMILGMLGALICAALYALGWFMGYQDAGRKEFGFFFTDDEDPEGRKRQEELWQKVMQQEPDEEKFRASARPGGSALEDEAQSAGRQATLSEEEKREIKRRMKAVNDIASFCGPRTQKGGR